MVISSAAERSFKLGINLASCHPERSRRISFASSAAAFFFCLDTKETKHQDLELMSGKFVKAFISESQAAMKNRRIRDAVDCGF